MYFYNKLYPMDLEKKLLQLKARYSEVNAAMSDPAVFDDPENYTKLTKERSDLEEVVKDFDRYSELKGNLEGNLELIEINEDPEITEMASAENKELKAELGRLEEELKIKLVPKDSEDSKNAIVEVRAGTGGDEAAIFAGDLFDMYRRYSDDLGWKLQILSLNESEKGGFKEISFSLEGFEVFGKMKYESGVHRVQRIPITESQGRVHTSAATVAVLPEAEEVDIKIKDADLRIDVFRSGGPGGQSVNTTDSAVRITHLPSGIVVSQQDEKSQHKNKAKALKILRARVYEVEKQKKDKERSSNRKSQIGTGDRSERIRTYNFPQGRVTDHRINLTLHKLEEFMEGEIFDEIVESLSLQAQEDELNKFVQ